MEFQRLQTVTFFSVLIGVSIAFFSLLWPYVYPIFWAAVLATLSYPIYKRILPRVKNNTSAASVITISCIVLIILVPLAGFISLLAQQAFQVYQQFGNRETFVAIGDFVNTFTNQPFLQDWFGNIDIVSRLESWAGEVGRVVYQFAASSGQATASTVIAFFIMLYTLFYFLRDGAKLLQKLRYLLPLGDVYEEQLFTRFVSTSKATLKGTLVIGLIQGVIGGVAFVVTGVPGWAFWMVVMILLSVIPAVGAGFVLIPAAVVFALLGGWWQAIVVLVAAGVAGVIDNILRGPLVGKDAQMHPLLIFFSTIGGLVAFGVSGVVVGPVLTAFFLAMWEIYSEKYKNNLSKAD